jgi:hypothetical protein
MMCASRSAVSDLLDSKKYLGYNIAEVIYPQLIKQKEKCEWTQKLIMH